MLPFPGAEGQRLMFNMLKFASAIKTEAKCLVWLEEEQVMRLNPNVDIQTDRRGPRNYNLKSRSLQLKPLQSRSCTV